MSAPHRVKFTDHAAERAQRYGLAYSDVADIVLDDHQRRQSNKGAAEWRVRRGRLVVVYDWPDDGDERQRLGSSASGDGSSLR